MNTPLNNRDTRTAYLLGISGVERLKRAHVAVFGIGGVGSYAVEALARAGVGALTLIDHDTVSESNINRQLIALYSTVGQYKTDVARDRIRDINPDSSLASTKAEVYDLIIAVDGKDLDTPDVLLDKIENGKVGDKLTLTLCRIGNDYSISEFDVTVELVEDKGTTSSTTSQEQLPNSYWEQFFGN